MSSRENQDGMIVDTALADILVDVAQLDCNSSEVTQQRASGFVES